MNSLPLTPADYWSIVQRRKWGVILIAACIITLTSAVALLLPSIYRSYSTIMIEQQQIPADFVMNTVNTFAEQRVENIKQRVLSFTQLWKVITEYNLYSDLREKLTPEEVVDKMRNDVKVQTVSAEIFDRRTGRPTSVTTSFVVSYEGKSPQAVLRVTDTLTSLFLQQNLEVRQQQIMDTSDFLGNEAERIRLELSLADKGVADFKEQHIHELPELFQVNMQSLNRIEQNIDQLRNELGSLKERESYLNAQLSSMSPYQEAVEERNQQFEMLKELKLQLARLQQRYTDEYPDIASLKDQIEELQHQAVADPQPLGYTGTSNGVYAASVRGDNDPTRLRNNPAFITLSSQLASTETDIGAVKEQILSFEERAEMYRQRVEATPRVEEVYQTLINHRNAVQAKYNDLVQKHQEARVAQELERDQKGERFTLIEPARLPEKPQKPNRLSILLIGIILAIGSGIGFGAIREFADQSVRSTDHLAALTNHPVFIGIPLMRTPAERSREKRRTIVICSTLILTIILLVTLFHFFVMDLDIFWSKVGRRLDRL